MRLVSVPTGSSNTVHLRNRSGQRESCFDIGIEPAADRPGRVEIRELCVSPGHNQVRIEASERDGVAIEVLPEPITPPVALWVNVP